MANRRKLTEDMLLRVVAELPPGAHNSEITAGIWRHFKIKVARTTLSTYLTKWSIKQRVEADVLKMQTEVVANSLAKHHLDTLQSNIASTNKVEETVLKLLRRADDLLDQPFTSLAQAVKALDIVERLMLAASRVRTEMMELQRASAPKPKDDEEEIIEDAEFEEIGEAPPNLLKFKARIAGD